jgi:hypothetical protein
VNGSGNWSIPVSPPLANGQYTAVARQLGPPPSNLLGSSDPVQFTISVSGPPPPPSTTVTLTHPAAGATVQQSAKLVFAGAAGNASGDSPTITVTLYRGSAANGNPVGTVSARPSNGSWSATWPRRLALGLYTAQASQGNGQGGTDVSEAVTFLVVPRSSSAPVSVDLSRSRLISIPISCQIAVGDCAGTVLAITVKRYQPVAGGPIGPIRLLFSYVAIPAGQTLIVRGHVSRAVQRALRHKRGRIKVKVRTSLNETGRGIVKQTSTLTLRLH